VSKKNCQQYWEKRAKYAKNSTAGKKNKQEKNAVLVKKKNTPADFSRCLRIFF